MHHHLSSGIHAFRVHYCPSQVRVLAREESILVFLHIINATTSETHAGYGSYIFYAIFHGGTVSVMRIVRVQLVCFLLSIPDGDAHSGLPISVLQRVRMLVVDVLHNYVPISVVGLKNPHKSVV